MIHKHYHYNVSNNVIIINMLIKMENVLVLMIITEMVKLMRMKYYVNTIMKKNIVILLIIYVLLQLKMNKVIILKDVLIIFTNINYLQHLNNV